MTKAHKGVTIATPSGALAQPLSSEERACLPRKRKWAARGLGAVLALALLLTQGCTHFPVPASPSPEPDPMAEAVVPTPTGNSGSYYYYLMAQKMWWDRNLDSAAIYLEKAILEDRDSLLIRRDLINVLMSSGKIERALEESNSLLSRYPDDPQALLTHGSLLVQANRHSEAVQVWEKALTLDPDRVDVYHLLGEMYQKMRMPDEAVAVYEKFLERKPHDQGAVSAWYFLGKIQFSQEKYKEAATAFKETLRLKPELTQVKFDLADAYEEMGDEKKILALYQELMEENPSDTFPHLKLAHFYLRKQEEAKAMAILEDARLKFQGDPLLERKIAHILLETDYYSQSTDIFAQLVSDDPKDDELLYYYAISLEGEGKTEEAIEVYRKVAPESSYYSQALVYVAYLSQSPEDAQKALENMEPPPPGDPALEEYTIHSANLSQQAGDVELAETILTAYLEKDPGNITMLFNLGVIYDKHNRKQECIEIMKRLLELDPEHANALNYLGYTYADLGIHLEEAKKLVMKALEITPDDGYITDSLGWVYYKMGDYKKALKILKKAVELAPDDPVIKEHLGDAYMKTGNPEKALELYRLSLPGQTKRGDDTTELKEKIKALEK